MSERADALTEALVAAGADEPFLHDGLIYFLVPRWVVEAYARCRLERLGGDATLVAMVTAHAGEQTVKTDGALPRWFFWRIGRAWAWRLGQLERKARGMPVEAAA